MSAIFLKSIRGWGSAWSWSWSSGRRADSQRGRRRAGVGWRASRGTMTTAAGEEEEDGKRKQETRRRRRRRSGWLRLWLRLRERLALQHCSDRDSGSEATDHSTTHYCPFRISVLSRLFLCRPPSCSQLHEKNKQNDIHRYPRHDRPLRPCSKGALLSTLGFASRIASCSVVLTY